MTVIEQPPACFRKHKSLSKIFTLYNPPKQELDRIITGFPQGGEIRMSTKKMSIIVPEQSQHTRLDNYYISTFIDERQQVITNSFGALLGGLQHTL